MMVISCSAYNCTNRWDKKNEISFHRFPLQNEELCKQWVVATKRKGFIPTKASFICSVHFKETDFLVRPGTSRRHLKSGAVPSLFRFPAHFMTLNKQPRRQRVKTIFESNEQIINTNIHGISSGQKDQGIQTTPEMIDQETQTGHLVICDTTIKAFTRKVKLLQERLRRREKNMYSMKDVMKFLKEEGHLTEKLNDFLSEMEGFLLDCDMEDQVFHKPEAVWLLEAEKLGTQIKEEPKAELARDGEIELASWESLETETLQVNRIESSVAVEMEPLPVLEDEIMLTHIKEEPEPDTVSDSEGASFDLKLVKREFCEGEAEEDETEDGRAHTPDGGHDVSSELEIEDNNILEDSSGCKQSPEPGGLQIRHNIAGSAVEAADHPEPDIEIPVQKESYECHICYMGFSQDVDLVLHTRKSHSGAKPFMCQHCKKSFKHRRYLKIHRRTHTGEKPFSLS